MPGPTPAKPQTNPAAGPADAATTIIFAGGGTGGHLFPGLAIAESLRELHPACRALFLCSNRPLDAEILRAAGADFQALDAAPFVLRPRKLVRFVRAWPIAVRQTRAAIAAARRDGAVHLVAMGGFVAAPAARAARAAGVPVTLVNLDATPGLANRWIARRAGVILTAARLDRPAPGPVEWRQTPPIVRRAALPPGGPEHCRRLLNLHPLRPVLLVTGGSQGAQSINNLMIELVRAHADAFRAGGWQVAHQAGSTHVEQLRAAYSQAQIPAVVERFFDPMGPCWGAAELALSRCGAGSVAEAWASRTPVVFLPYPYHKDEHQKRNARPLAEAGGAIVVQDLIEAPANAASAGRTLLDLLADPARRQTMRNAYNQLGPADGAKVVARHLLGL